MLCEGRLRCMIYMSPVEDSAVPAPQRSDRCSPTPPNPTIDPLPIGLAPGFYQAPADSVPASMDLHVSPLESLDLQAVLAVRQLSPGIEIPVQAGSGADAPFLVPSSCQSICQNYSDLHIGGDQVLPLSANDGEPRLPLSARTVRPFLQSCDVPPDVEHSFPGQAAQAAHPPGKGAARRRGGSGRDWSVLFQGHEGPFSNSLLNHYLEQKLLDLYQQYMVENMARQAGPGLAVEAGQPCPLLGSEMFLTSLDQITLQLSREGNLEAGRAKDMVLSCLLRVASDMQSSEISTPVLQISNEASREHLAEEEEES